MFESAGEAIVVTDLAGTIQYVNPAFERITGYSRAEAIGQNPRILKSGQYDDEFYRRLWRSIAGGHVWRGSMRNCRKDGSQYDAEQTIAPILDIDHRLIGYVSLHADVTERKRLEQAAHEAELRHAREAAEYQLRLVRQKVDIAAEVQQNLFPKAPPNLPGFDIAGAAFPADDTCGDYFDFIPMPKGRLGIVVADVVGHGLGAALLMVATRAYLHALCESVADIDEILRRANDLLRRDLHEGGFVTLFLGQLDPEQRLLRYVAAGHRGYHINTQGQLTELSNGGLMLGPLADALIPPATTVPLQRGDVIFIPTDGFAEAHSPNGTLFGIDSVLRVIQTHQHQSARTIIDELHAAVGRFTHPAVPQDDMTALVVKVTQ